MMNLQLLLITVLLFTGTYNQNNPPQFNIRNNPYLSLLDLSKINII